jgi:hypothetical protein
MSVASSSASVMSVGFHGGTTSLENALDETVRELQKHLNAVQCKLREIATICDQDPDYQEEIKMSGELDDDLREMCWLFDDLRQMCTDLISAPETDEEKLFLKQWKAQRKLQEKKLQKEHTEKVKAERKAAKEALKLARSGIAEGDEGETKE